MKRRGYASAYEALATILRDGRLQAGLTQAALAEKLGRPQSFVAKYEAGERQLDIIEFLLVARAIGLRTTRVIGRLEKQL
jgi:transcriptional regulator with XRE-family HTH domain